MKSTSAHVRVSKKPSLSSPEHVTGGITRSSDSARGSQSKWRNWQAVRFSLGFAYRIFARAPTSRDCRRPCLSTIAVQAFSALDTARARPSLFRPSRLIDHNGFLGHHHRPRRGRHALGDGRRRGTCEGAGMRHSLSHTLPLAVWHSPDRTRTHACIYMCTHTYTHIHHTYTTHARAHTHTGVDIPTRHNLIV